MSLSKPKLQNPCEKWIRFKGSTGTFGYWDKEQEEEVELSLPLKFIVLDELIKVSGYNKQSNSGIFSNEVRSTRDEELHVRTFKGVDELRGYYCDIKDSIKSLGGKFTKSIYAALITDDGLEMVNFEMRGAAFSEWLKWSKRKMFDQLIVTITGSKEGSNGGIVYKMPVFGTMFMDKQLLEKALDMDRELQNYLAKREDDKADDDVVTVHAEDDILKPREDDKPVMEPVALEDEIDLPF